MVFHTETKLGSDCTGVNGALNRTYATIKTSVNASSLIVVVNRSTLIPNTDYTFNSTTHTITFLVNIFDINSIYLTYDYTVSISAPSEDDLRYTTILNFNKYMLMNTHIPNRNDTNFPAIEEVGTGDNSTTQFTLNNGNIIENTQTISYGSVWTSVTDLILTTDYTIDNDLGVITLTSSGVTKVGTDKIFAVYDYNKYEIPNSTIKQALLAAEAEVDNIINSVFYDGTEETPDFGIIQNELQTGQGYAVPVYKADLYPINDTTTTLNGDVSADDGTITVVSTQGFPSTGFFAVDGNKITYTGKTTTTFTGCTNVLAHDSGDIVTSYVIETSLDDEGNTPTFTTLKHNTDYNINFENGEIKLNSISLSSSTVLDNYNPPYHVWDRIRLSYQYGYNEIYNEIKLVVHMLAGSQLFDGNVLNALARATNGFDTDSYSAIKPKIMRILEDYRCWRVSAINT